MGRKRTVLKQLFACLIAVTMLVPANIFSQSKLNTANAASSAAPVLNVASYRFITVGGSYDFNIRNAISGSSYVWKSSNTQIATVSKSGVVKAKTAGTATITCAIKAKGKSYKLSALVYVKNPVKSPAKEIKIMNKLNDLTIGDEYDLDTLFTPGKASDFVNWTSSDTNIATVNEKGIVQGIKAGKVTITATTLAGKVKDSVSIDVAPRIPDKVTATYGTPVIDGDIDAAWSNASVIVPKVYGAKTDVTAQHRIMWDDNALYVLSVVKDKTLDKSNSTTYQQDSLELFLDEKYDQGTAYKSDDMHYRVNFDNMRSVDSGDKARFYSKTKLTDDGYIVEACIVWDKATKPANNMEFGFDLQINEAKNGSRQTTINIFDTTGNAYQNPSLFGKMVLTGKGQDAVTGTNPYILLSYIDSVNAMSLDVYVNKDTVTEPLSNAEKVAASSTATQEEIDNAYLSLKKAVDGLNDGSGFAKPSSLAFNADLPDPFTFLNSSKVTTLADWQLRKDEIARMYEYYMYGVMPDTSGEAITTEYVTTFTMAGWFGPITMNVQPNQKFVKINITKDNKKIDFVAAITFPSTKDKDGTVKIVPPTHADGYPVVIVIGTLSDPQKSYLNDHGYAVIEFSNNEIAADNTSRTGDFYTLYPYGKSWDKQTGVLMAWAWGVSKIVDVIQKDAAGANDLHISPVNTIVNGVSRNGKAAAVAGAFDPRIKVTVPSSSGESGVVDFRYRSTGKQYNYKSLTKEEFIDFKGVTDGTAVYNNYQSNPVRTVGANESLSNSQASSGWFNDNFQGFKSAEQLPFDQHLLVSLTADKDRYYLITGEIDGGDWINPASMYVTYLAAQNVYDSLGISDNIGIHLHATGHALTLEDTKYLVEFCNKHLYGVDDGNKDLKDLKTSIFEEPANYDPYFDTVKKMDGPNLAK